MTQVIVEPAYEQWGSILATNQERATALSARLGPSFCLQLRQDIVREAREYTRSVRAIAQEAGLKLHANIGTLPTRPDMPILMAGHQPLVYHPGLLRKASMLSRITHGVGGIGVNVVIDTDQGDAGLLAWPRIHNGSLEIKRKSIITTEASHRELYYLQRIASAEVVRDVFHEMMSDMRQSGLSEQADRIMPLSKAYQALSGHVASVANSIVRWMVEDAYYDDLPLTYLVAGTRFREVLGQLVADGVHLAQVYNATLDSYRREHKIENLANPFPNLKNSSQGQELPLWCLDSDGRTPLYVSLKEEPQHPDCKLLCPRGSITTFLLRAYCCDLFIHGLGGAKYDAFVDAFASEYLGLELPQFVVASETRHLFPEQIERLSRELKLAAELKEMTSRTEEYIGKGIFSDTEEGILREAIETRARLRKAIQAAQTAPERSSIAHELNASNKAIRSIIEQGSLKPILARAAANEAALGLWSFREFPFFLFPAP